MGNTRLTWNEETRSFKANYRIEHVGNIHFEVDSNLPGGGARQSGDEKKALALRHAKLLVRSLAAELERQAR
ncbi:hypothetical protein [Taklimakanibacter lacteus]|uniref:hypothetical protein n=1 Tax=Taklimakanibacter lacteus TaxID=2268456 RepID=UPI000E66FD27